MEKNTRSRRNKMSVGAQIALGATCVLAVGASAVCGVFAGFHPDAALAFFKGENIYTQASADATAKAAQDAGYDAGYAVGNKTGHDNGYNMGFDAGKDAGYDAGYAVGNKDGHDNGYDAGYDAGNNVGYDAGYDAGNNVGYDAGYDAGNNAGYDSGYNVGFEAGKDAILEEQARYTPTPLESGKLYDRIYVNTSVNGFLGAFSAGSMDESVLKITDIENTVLTLNGGITRSGEKVITLGDPLCSDLNLNVLYMSGYFNEEGEVVLPGWHHIGKDGLLLNAEGDPLKLKIEFDKNVRFAIDAFFSSTPFGAFDPDAQEKYEYKATPLVDGEEYDRIFFTTDESVWAEVAEFVNSTDLTGDGGKGATILQSDNWLVLAYQLSMFDGNDAHKDDIIVIAGDLHDNYNQTIIYTSAKEAFETDHMGVIKPGINGVYADGIFDEPIGKYIKQGYKEGSSPEIPLLPDELLNRVISSTPFAPYEVEV